MKKLYLVRHAKSSWSDPKATDFERKLNKRGKRDAPFMAEKLAERGVQVDLIISSPAARTKKTAKFMAKGIDYSSKNIQYKEKAYSFTLKDLLGVVKKIDDAHTSVMVVGHNYAITDLAEYLTEEVLVNIPTAGIVGMEADITHWSDIDGGCAKLLFFDYPKKFLP